MYKRNQRSQQPLLFSDVNNLPERSKKLLQGSWAATFREEVFLRIKEARYAVLYADCPSRPNVPVNVLMGLEILKAGYGWSDAELYEHFMFDLQVRYALCCDNFGEGDFDVRSLYHFRQRISQYRLEKGVNLVAETFADITDQPLAKLEIKTGMQRMDSTQLAANMADLSRLELLVRVLQRLHRMLSAEDQAHYQTVFAPYIQEGAGQYSYRIKGKEAVWEHIQQVGVVLHALLGQLPGSYGQHSVYGVAQRFFAENFKLVEGQVQAKANQEIQAGCLQSLDDLEASYRVKGKHAYKGYVANLTETCDPVNPVQLVTHISVAPNRTNDQDLLCQAVPEIQERMDLTQMNNDGEFVGPQVDQVLREHHIEQLTTALTGTPPDRSDGKLVMADFAMQLDEPGNVTAATCPAGHAATVTPSAKGQSFRLAFAPATCLACPLQPRCPVQLNKQQTTATLLVPKERAASSQRRRRFEQCKDVARQLRPAIEATVFQFKHKLSESKVRVRGLFRVTYLALCAGLALNARRLDRHRKGKLRGKFTKLDRKSPTTTAPLPVDALFVFRNNFVSLPRPRFVRLFCSFSFC